jgi:ABC-type phosphate/phosphonate transport system substrate-binding protein
MYNVTTALAADWRAVLAHVQAGLRKQGWHDELAVVDAPAALDAFWQRPDLLLSQTCGYPLLRHLQDCVQLVGTPVFNAPGCAGPLYSSEIVVAARSRHTGLATCRGAIAALNQWDSNSGMNAFRHAVAPLARDGAFFSAVVATGSHVESLRSVASGRADVAAIDCVTLAFVRCHLPDLASAVRVIGRTLPSPGLPLIASRSVSTELVAALRTSLDDLFSREPALAARLRLVRFDRLELADYDAIRQMEEDARASGYARLA